MTGEAQHDPLGARLATAAAWAFVAATAAYPLLRGAESLLAPALDPITVMGSAKSPLVWRSVTALYLGGAGGIGGFALATRAPAAGRRWLGPAIVLAAAGLAAQGALLP